MVATYRRFSGSVAERKTSIGEPADGRVRTVAEQSKLDAFPSGWVGDDHVIELFVERLHALSARLRERTSRAAEQDPVTEDLFIEITHEIEEQAWMMEAQRAPCLG